MKNKIDFAFVSVIIIEILLIGILYLFLQNPCGNACNTQSLINPFGFYTPEICTMQCVESQHFLFYPLADITAITILGYLIFLIKRKMKGGIK